MPDMNPTCPSLAKLNRKALCTFAGLLLAATAPTASASLMTAQVTLDWNSLTVTPLDTGSGLPSLTWTSGSDRSYLYSNGTNNYGGSLQDNANNWTHGTLASRTDGTSLYSLSQESSTTPSILSSASSFDSAAGGFLNQSWTTYSQRRGGFTVHGEGVLLFQINYALDADTDSTRYGFVTSNASLVVSTYSGGSSGSQTMASNKTFYNPSTGSRTLTDSGVLTVALFFRDGWTGNLSAEASIYGYVSGYEGNGGGGPYVPVPSMFWLFSGLMAGLFRYTRRTALPATA